MSGLDKKEVQVTVTEHSEQLAKRSAQAQVAWETDLMALLRGQREKYAEAITRAFMRTQPPGVIDMSYLGDVPKMRTFLHEKYGVTVSSTGVVTVAPKGTPEDKIAAVYLGVLELQAQSAVPIISGNGGSVEEHITLLTALLSVDFSLPLERVREIAVGIRAYAEDMSPVSKHELETLISLSEVNSLLHERQQGYEKPLSQAERRAELVAWIEKDRGKENSNPDFLLGKLTNADAMMETVGKSLLPKPALSWIQSATSEQKPVVPVPSAPTTAIGATVGRK